MPELGGKYKHNPGTHRNHTPITSRAQQGLMGAELSRRRRGKKRRMGGITTAELRSHLKESAGKNLPPFARALKDKHGR